MLKRSPTSPKRGPELRGNPRGSCSATSPRAERGTITLVFGAKDAEHSNAAALKLIIKRMQR